jgi:hypothetical protein
VLDSVADAEGWADLPSADRSQEVVWVERSPKGLRNCKPLYDSRAYPRRSVYVKYGRFQPGGTGLWYCLEHKEAYAGTDRERMRLAPCPAVSVTIFHAAKAPSRPIRISSRGARLRARSAAGDGEDTYPVMERVLKAARASYKAEGKKERQSAQLPKLLEGN